MKDTRWLPTRHDIAADLIGGAVGGALVAYWLAWSTGRLIDPSRLVVTARNAAALVARLR